MSRAEQVILTNMCMVSDEKGRILVLNRVKDSWKGLCFPGGHIEPKESIVKSVIREIKEETGLTIKHPTICGVKQFYTKTEERYLVLLFTANEFTGTLRSSDEGEVFWIYPEELNKYQLSENFREMYTIFTSDLSEYYHYRDGDTFNYKLY